MKQPPALSQGHVENFETLKRACLADDLALISAIRKADDAPVALVCAMSHDGDTIMPVPLAVMVEGDPFELFHDPTQ
jgi:hypothetical protein